MSNPDFLRSLRTYLIENFQEVEHPVEPFDASRRLSLPNIESTVDALLALLRLPTTVTDAKDLEKQVQFSFREHLSASDLEIERRVRAAGHLAERLEAFLKKLFARRHPDIAMPDSLGKLLKEDVGGYQGKLEFKPTDEVMLAALRLQRTEQAVIHDAYYFRNTWAHKARQVSPSQEQRYWQSVIAAFLLIAERNKDLVPAVRKRADRAARIRSGLRLCLQHVRTQFDDAKWHREYYIRLSTDRASKLDDYVDAFFESQTDRLLVIAGRTGAGKTTFLERLVVQLADQALYALSFETPGHLTIPVHLELKRYTPGKRTYLVKKLYNTLNPKGNLGIRTRQIAFWPQFLSPNQFVLCLDGLDEVSREAWPTVVSELDELVTDFDNVKVIVTTRPHAVPDHWNESLVHILPLPPEEVIAYFGHGERLHQLASDAQAFLRKKPDIVDILQEPLMAEAACRYWRQFEPSDSKADLDPSTCQEALLEGPLLEHLYQCFFTHHVRRAFQKQLVDYERVRQQSAVAKLALKMDGDLFANFEFIANAFAKFEAGATTTADLLELFLDIGLLKPHDSGFAFRNETIKTYFAAVGLRDLLGKQDLDEAFSFIRQANRFWRRCVKLLKEIASVYHHVSAIEGYLASLAEA
jgi:hypothetical protein